jgi:hypothetical protein
MWVPHVIEREKVYRGYFSPYKSIAPLCTPAGGPAVATRVDNGMNQ